MLTLRFTGHLFLVVGGEDLSVGPHWLGRCDAVIDQWSRGRTQSAESSSGSEDKLLATESNPSDG